MNKKDMKDYKKLLLDLYNSLDSEVRHIAENNLKKSQKELTGDLSGYSIHMADMGTDNFEREMELGIATGETDRLRLVEEALRRIKDGSYGRCLDCGKDIKPARLKAVPYATLCIHCQSAAEKDQRA